MREKEMDLLVKEIEIPEIVQRKADIAFKRIQEEDWERRRQQQESWQLSQHVRRRIFTGAEGWRQSFM